MGSEEYNIYRALFKNYNKNIKPDSTIIYDVLIALRFFTLVGLDQKEGILSFSGDFEMRWKDPSLAWNPSAYGGRAVLMIPESNVWVPDVTVYNSVGQQTVIDYVQRKVVISSNGMVVRSNPSIFNTLCAVSMDVFPFDTQDCYMKLSSWVYPANEVSVESPSWLFNYSTPQVTLLKFTIYRLQYNGDSEWTVESLNVKRVNKTDYDGTIFEELEYKVTLKRHSSYYLNVLMIPTYIVSMLSLIGLFTPFDNEGNRTERVTLGLTTLLSLSVILNIVGDEIPKSTDLPKLGSFVMAECLLCFVAVLVTVVLVFVHQRVQTRRILSAGLVNQHKLPATKKGMTGLRALKLPPGLDKSVYSVEEALIELVQYIELLERRDEHRCYWVKKLDTVDLFFLVLFQLINLGMFLLYIFIR